MTGLDFPASLADNNFVLMDPMCGSGTLAIEAALMMCNTAPGLFKYGLDTDNGSTRQAPAGRGKRTPPLPGDRCQMVSTFFRAVPNGESSEF